MVENKLDEYSQQDLQDMLKIYYKRLFPRISFYRWLTYSHCKLISLKLHIFIIRNFYIEIIFNFIHQPNHRYFNIASFHLHWPMKCTFDIYHMKLNRNLRMICLQKIHSKLILVQWWQFDRKIIALGMCSRHSVSLYSILIWPIMMRCVHAVRALMFVKNVGNSWSLHVAYWTNHCEVCKCLGFFCKFSKFLLFFDFFFQIFLRRGLQFRAHSVGVQWSSWHPLLGLWQSRPSPGQ